MEFTGICIVTDKVVELTNFYKKLLAVDADGDENHADLRTDVAAISIFSKKGMDGLAPGSMDSSGSGNITLNFRVENVDKEYDRVSTFGVEFIKLPTTHPWGARSFWFRDPDGNIVNFFGIL